MQTHRIQRRDHLDHVGTQVAVAQLDPLGHAGGAGGKRQHGDVRSPIHLHLWRLMPFGQERLENGGLALGGGEVKDIFLFDAHLLRRLQSRRAQKCGGEHHLRLGNLELLFDILHRGQRADSGDRGSGAHCPVEHDSEDQRVRAVQRHYIMRLHTPVREGSGECIHHCFELAIRGLRAGGAIDDGDALGVFRLEAL